MTESLNLVLQVTQTLVGLMLVFVGVCRGDLMNKTRARWAVRAAYSGIVASAAAMACGAWFPAGTVSVWQTMMMLSIALLLGSTRDRWADGPPEDLAP